MGTIAIALVVFGAAVSFSAPSEEDVRLHLESRAKSWSTAETAILANEVFEQSDTYGLDPELVLAVMAVESSFRFRARSRAGALGLMQVMPSTGRSYARLAGVRWRGPRTLYDPVANIRIGTLYLARLLRRFDGDLDLALTSYCHGVGKVNRLIDAQGRLSYRKLRYSRRVRRQLARFRRARSGHDDRSTKRYRRRRSFLGRRRI